jgi:hypothetical protein
MFWGFFSFQSAIKAKLVDLGAYVGMYCYYVFCSSNFIPLLFMIDDELPDYIMVMVANKKTAAQMSDDLNLFLGNNTLKFTSWLVIGNQLLGIFQAHCFPSGSLDYLRSYSPSAQASNQSQESQRKVK